MSNGKANTTRSTIDEIIKLKRDKAKAFGIARTNLSVSTGAVLGTSGSRGVADAATLTAKLQTQGDTMVGPLAFFPIAVTISSGTIDVENSSTGDYTSRIFLSGEGAVADDLTTINGVEFSGQVLYLQAISSTPITLKQTGNIYIPSGSDYTIDGLETVMLMWDGTNGVSGKWSVIANFSDTSSSGVTEDQSPVTWTGIHTFNGSSTSINSATIILGDETTDNINIGGRFNTDLDPSADGTKSLGSASLRWNEIYGSLVVGDSIVASTSFSSTGTTTLGNTSNDVINVIGRISTDIDPDTDGTLSLGSSSLRWNNIYGSLLVANSIVVDTSFTSTGTTTLGNGASDSINIIGRIRTNISIDSGKIIKAYDSTETGYFVENYSGSVGTAGSLQLPSTTSTSIGNNTDLNSAFGSGLGCAGVYNISGTTPILAIKIKTGTWALVTLPDSGAAIVGDHVT